MFVGSGLNGAPSVMPSVDTYLGDSSPPAWACSTPSATPVATPVDTPPATSAGSTDFCSTTLTVDNTRSLEVHKAASPQKPKSSSKKKRGDKQTQKQHEQLEEAQLEPWQFLLAESWSEAKATNTSSQNKKQTQDDSQETVEHAKSSKKGFFQWGRGSAGKGTAAAEHEDGNEPIGGVHKTGQKLPETFDEMMIFNCKMMGANTSWINIVMQKLDSLVASVASGSDAYLELDASFLALRFHKEAQGKIDLRQFQISLLASLRSLIGDTWSAEHESAWSRMWNLVTEKLNGSLPCPAKFEKAVLGLFKSMPQEDKRKLGQAVFRRLFEKIPETEKYFKQNNERLIFIVTRALEMSGEIYDEPARLIEDTQALGLRHIMYNVPTEYFEPFVLCCVEELELYTTDVIAVEGVAWTLNLVGALLVRVIEETATPLIRAVLANNPKQVRKALGSYARQDRAASAI